MSMLSKSMSRLLGPMRPRGFFVRGTAGQFGMQSSIRQVSSFDSRQTPENEVEAREELAAGFRIGDRMGLGDVVWGHMSLRIPDTEHFLTIDFPQEWCDATATNLVKVDIQGNIMSDPSGRCTRARLHPAWQLHAAIHRHRPDAHCVVHTHTDEALAFVGLGQRELLPINQEAMVFSNRLSWHEYNTEPYMSGVVPAVAKSIGKVNRAMLLDGHGLMTLGETVGEAVVRMKALNQSIKTQLLAMSTGCKLKPQPQHIADHFASYISEGFDHGRYEWQVLLEQDYKLRPSATWTDVSNFWFGSSDSPNQSLWFGGHPPHDELIRQRFGSLLMQALSGGLSSWGNLGWQASVAAIVVLDQFPRMVFRKQSAAFAGDKLALGMAKELLSDKNVYKKIPLLQRLFVILPLQHSEDLMDQAEAVHHVCDLRKAAAGTPLEDFFEECLQHARAHQAVINRLGRFPHRDAALGRVSSADEVAYLNALEPQLPNEQIPSWMHEHRSCLSTWGQ